MGLLDTGGFDDPNTMGLLSFGARMSSAPGGFMRALGPSVLGALGDRGDARKDIGRQQQEAMRLQLLQQQMEDAQMKRLEQQAAQQREAQFREFVLSNQDPAAAQRKALELQQMNPMDFVNGMKPKARELMKLEQMKGPDGKMANVAFFKDGSHEVLPYGVKPEIALQNLGNRLEVIDKNDVQGGQSFKMGQSPDSVASNAVAMRGQNMTDARSREATAATREAGGGFQYKDDGNGGYVALPNKPTGPGPIQGIPVAGVNKSTKGASDAIALIKQAKELIPGATGSYAGAGIDQAARVFGASTDGAKATAKLKAIEGALMLKQPRMEGPQSNMDTILYRQMAGQIGDPTVPSETKLAALDAIQEMQERYAGVKKEPPKLPTAKPGSTLKFDKFGNMVP